MIEVGLVDDSWPEELSMHLPAGQSRAAHLESTVQAPVCSHSSLERRIGVGKEIGYAVCRWNANLFLVQMI